MCFNCRGHFVVLKISLPLYLDSNQPKWKNSGFPEPERAPGPKTTLDWIEIKLFPTILEPGTRPEEVKKFYFILAKFFHSHGHCSLAQGRSNILDHPVRDQRVYHSAGQWSMCSALLHPVNNPVNHLLTEWIQGEQSYQLLTCTLWGALWGTHLQGASQGYLVSMNTRFSESPCEISEYNVHSIYWITLCSYCLTPWITLFLL